MREPSFLDFSEPVCSDNFIADLGKRCEVPDLLMIERVGVFSFLEEYARHCGEVILKTVVAA